MKCKYCGQPATVEIWNLSCPAHLSGYACENCAAKFNRMSKIIQIACGTIIIGSWLILFYLGLRKC